MSIIAIVTNVYIKITISHIFIKLVADGSKILMEKKFHSSLNFEEKFQPINNLITQQSPFAFPTFPIQPF